LNSDWPVVSYSPIDQARSSSPPHGDAALSAGQAAHAVNASGFIAQGIAWDGEPVLEAHENAVISAGGAVLHYGRFYGLGTYYEKDLPPAPFR
jgi:hypothetical protein